MRNARIVSHFDAEHAVARGNETLWSQGSHTAGEIGDICAWQTKQLGAYTVQLEWSNQAGSCV